MDANVSHGNPTGAFHGGCVAMTCDYAAEKSISILHQNNNNSNKGNTNTDYKPKAINLTLLSGIGNISKGHKIPIQVEFDNTNNNNYESIYTTTSIYDSKGNGNLCYECESEYEPITK